MVECPRCKGKTIRIMGDIYCPTCFARGAKSHKKKKSSIKQSFFAIAFGFIGLAIIASFFSMVYSISFDYVIEPVRYLIFVLAVVISFFTGGAIIYTFDRDNYVLSSLILSLALVFASVFFSNISSTETFANSFRIISDFFLFLILFLTGAFLINHHRSKK